MNHSEQILNLREKITFQEDKTKSPIEHFQHKTLRPILKFLNETLNKLSLNFTLNLNPDFLHLNPLEQEKQIVSILKKEQVLKNKLVGVVVGLFTQEEVDFYLNNYLKIDERIQQMIQERIRTQFMNFLPKSKLLSDQ